MVNSINASLVVHFRPPAPAAASDNHESPCGIIAQNPTVGEWLVKSEEVSKSSPITTLDVRRWDVVAAALNADGDAFSGEFDAG
jgi:hypothetical protein